MTGLPSNTLVWLAAGHTDMRRGFDGLAGLVQTALAANPYSGHVFVFRGKRGNQTTFNIPIQRRRDSIPLASALRQTIEVDAPRHDNIVRYSGEGRNPGISEAHNWIPAFAGATACGPWLSRIR